MNRVPLLKDDELFQLIPQRAPIVMIDAFYEGTASEAHTGLTIRTDNLFCRDGKLTEPGLIEHIAQSAAAFAGYETYSKGLPPKLGFIGEVKKCRINRLPETGKQLYTHLTIIGEAAGVTLLKAETSTDNEAIVTCQMKIFLKD